ncbi:MAG: hypothetical protein H0T79_08050 [Deltaproteobacteria bacterium]|nr:hypothetical protein [Deltaproteobacteria bacterium]
MKQGLASLAIAVSVAGCSLAFVHGPGDVGTPPRVYAECTDSLLWPVIDGVLGLSSLGIILNPDDTEGSGTGSNERAAQITSGVIMAAAFTASAIYGWTRVSSCQESRAAFLASAPPPQPMYYPPQPYAPQPYPQGPQPGTEGGVCMASNVCAQGLVCASNLCVRAPSGPPGGY